MPIYTFICDTELNGCGHKFELFMSMKNYTPKQTCPKCRHKNSVIRYYKADQLALTTVKLSDDQLNLGHLAKRNGEKMSADEMAHKTYEHNKYKYNKETYGDLPKGMEHMGYVNDRKVSKKRSRRQLNRKGIKHGQKKDK